MKIKARISPGLMVLKWFLMGGALLVCVGLLFKGYVCWVIPHADSITPRIDGMACDAVNSFVALMAFIGMVVTVWVQSRQIKEMRKTYKIQEEALKLTQLPSIEMTNVDVQIRKPCLIDTEKPKLVIPVRLSLRNITTVPAIGIIGRVGVWVKDNGRTRRMNSCIQCPIISNGQTIDVGCECVGLDPDHTGFLIKDLVTYDNLRYAAIKVELFYKNVLGAYFKAEKAFVLKMNSGDRRHFELLNRWLDCVVNFEHKFYKLIEACKTVSESEKADRISQLRGAFEMAIGEEDDYGGVSAIGVDSSCSIAPSSQEKYEEYIRILEIKNPLSSYSAYAKTE